MADGDDELEKLAMEELMNEAKRGRERSETMGSLAWKKCPIPRANKRFLHNTLMSTIRSGAKKPRVEGGREKLSHMQASARNQERRLETESRKSDEIKPSSTKSRVDRKSGRGHHQGSDSDSDDNSSRRTKTDMGMSSNEKHRAYSDSPSMLRKRDYRSPKHEILIYKSTRHKK